MKQKHNCIHHNTCISKNTLKHAYKLKAIKPRHHANCDNERVIKRCSKMFKWLLARSDLGLPALANVLSNFSTLPRGGEKSHPI